MQANTKLPDRLQWVREILGDEVFYRFANGLTIKTETFYKDDALRILPLGTPQGSLMNHMLHFPEVVRDKRVLEPFAGSGALGLMALKAGARHVDFLDINGRAVDFQRDNAARNEFPRGRFRCIQGDIATFCPEETYDLMLANPPFVPTPDGIDGTVTSNGGSDGNRFVEILLRRVGKLLRPEGEALVYVFQIVSRQQPLLVDLVLKYLEQRRVDLTPSQTRSIRFETYCRAYSRLFPASEEAIVHWKSELMEKHGEDLSLCHYIMQIGPRSGAKTCCIMRDDFSARFGEGFLVPSDNEEELAIGRVFENVLPSARVKSGEHST
jgi:SAM-dependent methyltransferase